MKIVGTLSLFLFLGTPLFGSDLMKAWLPNDVYSKMAMSLINIATNQNRENISDEIINYLQERAHNAALLLNGEATNELAQFEFHALNSEIARANLKKHKRERALAYNLSYNNPETGAIIREHIVNSPCPLKYIAYNFTSTIREIVIIAIFEQIKSYHNHSIVANFIRQYDYNPFSKQGLAFPLVAIQQAHDNNYPRIISEEDFYSLVDQDDGNYINAQLLFESEKLARTVLEIINFRKVSN